MDALFVRGMRKHRPLGTLRCRQEGEGHPLHHVSIDRGFGLIRKWTTSDAAVHDGAGGARPDVACRLVRSRTSSTAYGSVKNEATLSRRGFLSRIHRKNRQVGRCPSAFASPTARNRRSVAPWRTSSMSEGGPRPSLCELSGSQGQG